MSNPNIFATAAEWGREKLAEMESSLHDARLTLEFYQLEHGYQSYVAGAEINVERLQANVADTRAALADFERLAALAEGLQVTDFQADTNDPSFPQFEASLGIAFAHGGAEGVRADEQHARIRPVETVETESLLGLLCSLECRRRNEAADEG